MSQPSPKEDPWEARERQWEQWRRAAERKQGGGGSRRGSRRSSTGGDSPSLWEDATGGERGLREDYLVWGILATVGMLLFSEVPDIDGRTREYIARAATLLLLLLLGSVRGLQENLRVALRRGPNPAIWLMVGWSIFEAIRAPYHSFAITDLLRILDGAGVYSLCAYCLRAPRQTGFVATGLIVMGVFLALEDIARTGQRGIGRIGLHESVFGTHENAGSLLVLLLPLALSFALSAGIEEKRRLAAAAASLVLGVALLVARTRSAWVGGLVALATLAFLLYRFPNDGSDSSGRSRRSSGRGARQSRRPTPIEILSSPATLIAAAMLLFLLIGGAAPWVLQRFVSLKSPLQDDSFSSRVSMWASASQMASERPLTGWGLGTFPIIQAYWTHAGVDEAEAIQVGIGHDNIAHDYYVQTAADTGVVGVGLYVAALGLFFVSAARALPRVTAPPQRALLCGAVATVAGAVVDAIASPAYQFHGVWTVLWGAIGLGVAAMRPLPLRASAGGATPPAADAGTPPTPLVLLPVVAIVAAAVPFAIVAWGRAIVVHGATVPRGTFELRAAPLHHPAPGETIRWTAVFHDAANRDLTTAAGTIWRPSVSAGGANGTALTHAKATLADSRERPNDPRHGIFQLVTPTLAPGADGAPPQITMRAIYRDAQGRLYSADSVVTVRVLKTKR